MKSQTTWLLTLALPLALAGLTLCANAEENKLTLDPTGTWKVTLSSTNTQNHPSENTLKLKMNGGALTGTLSRVSTANGTSMTWEIKEAKLQGSDISFKVMNGDVTSNYKGKISGDAMKGMLKMESSGKTSTRDWEARRLNE